eukprot:TRINITY_DN5330_c0_g1_i1.p1 TRINITY_DN5330_c0_g1~~TRINITY_DN5330_c0_g1_i1.p1  ORF type:complete len:440 (-),score=79.87 TRINITY_DN5330_c0_g1_i1:26-1345(-)
MTTTAAETSVWKEILASSARENHSLKYKTVVCFGDAKCGKTSLLSTLQPEENIEGVSRGIALTFGYFDVRSPAAEDSDGVVSRCRLWEFDAESDFSSVLAQALNADNVTESAVLICLDLSQPWSLLDSLKKWFEVMKAHLGSLGLAPGTLKRPSTEGVEEQLGIPLIVACCKSDTIANSAKLRTIDFDHIQYHLRKACLRYGAGLLYTSAPPEGKVTDRRNIQVLQDYILHVLYDFPLHHQADPLNKDALFVPIGYDSGNQLDDFLSVILKRNTGADREAVASAEKFHQFVPKPAARVIVNDAQETIVAQAEQAFLGRLRAMAEKEDGPEPVAAATLIGVTPAAGPESVPTIAPDSPVIMRRDSLRPPLPPGIAGAVPKSSPSGPRRASVAPAAGEAVPYNEISKVFSDLLNKGRSQKPASLQKQPSAASLLPRKPADT